MWLRFANSRVPMRRGLSAGVRANIGRLRMWVGAAPGFFGFLFRSNMYVTLPLYFVEPLFSLIVRRSIVPQTFRRIFSYAAWMTSFFAAMMLGIARVRGNGLIAVRSSPAISAANETSGLQRR